MAAATVVGKPILGEGVVPNPLGTACCCQPSPGSFAAGDKLSYCPSVQDVSMAIWADNSRDCRRSMLQDRTS